MASKVQVTKVHTYTGHKDAIYTLESGFGKGQFFSSGGDGQVIQWDLNNFDSGQLIAKVPSSIYALNFLREKNVLIIGQNHEGIHMIDMNTKRAVGSVKLTQAAIFDIKVYNDLVIIAAGEGELFVVDLNSLSIVKRSIIADKNLRVILVMENKCLIGTSDGQIIEINLESLNIEHQKTVHENSVFTLAQRSSDDFVLSGSRDARIKYWNTNPLILEESINAHMYAINHIAIDPTLAYFATASMDKTIKIWDYKERKLLKVIDRTRHDGHWSSVNKLLWTGYNDYLLSCSDDRSIGIWSLKIPK